jgi:membrane associated rhomboid family serine protease
VRARSCVHACVRACVRACMCACCMDARVCMFAGKSGSCMYGWVVGLVGEWVGVLVCMCVRGEIRFIPDVNM